MASRRYRRRRSAGRRRQTAGKRRRTRQRRGGTNDKHVVFPKGLPDNYGKPVNRINPEIAKQLYPGGLDKYFSKTSDTRPVEKEEGVPDCESVQFKTFPCTAKYGSPAEDDIVLHDEEEYRIFQDADRNASLNSFTRYDRTYPVQGQMMRPHIRDFLREKGTNPTDSDPSPFRRPIKLPPMMKIRRRGPISLDDDGPVKQETEEDYMTDEVLPLTTDMTKPIHQQYDFSKDFGEQEETEGADGTEQDEEAMMEERYGKRGRSYSVYDSSSSSSMSNGDDEDQPPAQLRRTDSVSNFIQQRDPFEPPKKKGLFRSMKKSLSKLFGRKSDKASKGGARRKTRKQRRHRPRRR